MSTLKNNISKAVQFAKKHYNITLILFFLFLSVFAVFPFWHTGYLYSGPDMQFHLSRIEEWTADIKQGGLFTHPIIATHTFNQVGDATPTMYSWVTLLPFVLFMMIMKPISAIYCGFTLIIWVTLILAYISMHELTKSKRLSFYFAILYGYTTFVLYEVLNFQMGTALAYPFLPIAFAGLYIIMRKNYKKWYWLTLGFTGIIYSHTLSTFIYLIIFIIIYGLYYSQQPRGERLIRFKYLIFSGCITALLSCIVWVPILRMMIDQPMNDPAGSNLYNILNEPSIMINNPFQDNSFNEGFGFFIALIIIFGFIALKKTPVFIHKYYYFGLTSLVVISTLFPWQLISTTPTLKKFNFIQRTSRFLPVCILLLSIYGAYLLNHLISSSTSKNKFVTLNIIFILLNLLIVFNFNYSGLYKVPAIFESTLPYKATYIHQVPTIIKGNHGYKINNSTFYNQFPEENETGMTDYTPKLKNNKDNRKFGNLALRHAILNHKGFYINQPSTRPIVNGITYNLKIPMVKGNSLILPFFMYNSLHYKIRFNGILVHPYENKNNLLKIYIPFHVASNANISIKCIQPYHILLMVITLVTWIWLLLSVYNQKPLLNLLKLNCHNITWRKH